MSPSSSSPQQQRRTQQPSATMVSMPSRVVASSSSTIVGASSSENNNINNIATAMCSQFNSHNNRHIRHNHYPPPLAPQHIHIVFNINIIIIQYIIHLRVKCYTTLHHLRLIVIHHSQQLFNPPNHHIIITKYKIITLMFHLLWVNLSTQMHQYGSHQMLGRDVIYNLHYYTILYSH